MITITNSRNESIKFTNKPPFLLRFFEGEGATPNQVQMVKSPYQDGQSYIDTLLEPREIEFTCALMAEDQNELFEYRSKISRVLNPKLGKVLVRYEYGEKVRIIEAVTDQQPFFGTGRENKSSTYQDVIFSLLCPNPFWQTEEIESEPAFQPLFQFPFDSEFEMGLQQDSRIINNRGDVHTPIQIDFYGPAENPRIENVTTGDFIKVNRTLSSNDILRIDTTFGNVSVELIGENGSTENVLNWIDLESTFFQLEVGENQIDYTADTDIQGARVDMFYRNYFVGI